MTTTPCASTPTIVVTVTTSFITVRPFPAIYSGQATMVIVCVRYPRRPFLQLSLENSKGFLGQLGYPSSKSIPGSPPGYISIPSCGGIVST